MTDRPLSPLPLLAAAALLLCAWGCATPPDDEPDTAIQLDALPQDGGQDGGVQDAGPQDSATSDAGAADSSASADGGQNGGDAGGAGADSGAGSNADSGAGSADAGQADAGPDDVVQLSPGPAVKAVVEDVSKGPWTFAAPVYKDVAIGVDKKGKVSLIGPLDGQLDPVEGSLDKPSGALSFDGLVYAVDTAGLHAILKAKLKASPLNGLLPKAPISATYVAPNSKDSDLWLVSGAQLLLYREGKLFTVKAAGLDATGAALSHGGVVDGEAALWVGGPAGLHAMRVSTKAGGKVTSWHYLKGRAVDGVHVDAKGRVWVASKGELLRRDAPGAWMTFVLDDPAQRVLGRPGDNAFWVWLKSGLARWEAEGLHPVTGAPAVASWQLDPAGLLSGLTSGGALVRLSTTEPPAKPKITWKGEIAPLFEKSCALCHGIDGVNTKLHTSALWKKHFSKILKNVESGAMPLPPKSPLTPGEIALIKTWEKDGFKESP